MSNKPNNVKHKLIIANEQIRARAGLIVSGLPIDGSVEVIVRPHKLNRSACQNSYYWSILTVIGNDLGNTKDEMHDIYRGMFLSPIFSRDDDGYEALLKMADGSELTRAALLARTSTTQADVKQMTEYLDDIAHHAASLGIRLPAPEYK